MTETIHARRTPNEIEDLKRQWLSDSCWDIEETDGFEAHRDELLAFRQEQEKKWARERSRFNAAQTAHRDAAHTVGWDEREVAKQSFVRRPVGVSEFCEAGGIPYTVVVCDDGSLWTLVGGRWTEEGPIPGTERWFELNPFMVEEAAHA